MAKLWGGRFSKATDVMVDDFNSSIRFDKRMYKQDIMGSIAHAKMLGKQNIIPKEDSEKNAAVKKPTAKQQVAVLLNLFIQDLTQIYGQIVNFINVSVNGRAFAKCSA